MIFLDILSSSMVFLAYLNKKALSYLSTKKKHLTMLAPAGENYPQPLTNVSIISISVL